MKDKIIVFDFDGTLADSFLLIYKSIEFVFSKRGLTLSLDDLLTHFGPTEKGILLNYFNNDEKTFDDYLCFYKNNHEKYLPNLIQGAEDTLCYLKNINVTTILLTGRSKESCDISLDFFSLRKYFYKIYTGSDKGVNKPDSFRHLFCDFNCSYDDVIYIGDSKKDTESCKEVGVKLISFANDNIDNYNKLKLLNNLVCMNYKEVKKEVNKFLKK